MGRALLFSCLLFFGACSDDTKPAADGTLPREAAVDQGADGPAADGPAADLPAADLPNEDATPDLIPPGDLSWADGTFPKCAAVSGNCTEHRWVICPAGFEPVDPDPRQDCGDGWCCVVAPASTCSASVSANCVVGTQCTGCWGPATNSSLTCEAGRVCCEDICD